MTLRSKRTRLAAIALAFLAVTGIAVAYWTSGGSGSGSGAVADPSGDITVTGTTSGDLVPGGSVPVSFTARNNSTESAARLGTISLAGVTADAAHAGCDGDWFSMNPVLSNQDIAAGASGVALTAGGTLSMTNDPAVNQDACKGATLTLELTATAAQ